MKKRIGRLKLFVRIDISRKKKKHRNEEKISIDVYMNSVKRVNQGCKPSELLIGPMINARLISGMLANSMGNIRMIIRRIREGIYWCNIGRYCRFE